VPARQVPEIFCKIAYCEMWADYAVILAVHSDARRLVQCRLRTGRDVIKTMTRLGVDEMKLFRTLCLVFAATLTFSASAADKVFQVNVKINESISSADRGTKYDDPLAAALKDANAGEVVGGGNSVNKQGKIEWAGIDLEVNNLDLSIPLIKQKLIDLGAPKGSTIEYRNGGKKVVVPVQ
jgi:hypothetical protein